MSSCSQYLEIDSTFRERSKFPKSSNFNVDFDVSHGTTNLQAIEALTDAYPYYGRHGIDLSYEALGFGTPNIKYLVHNPNGSNTTATFNNAAMSNEKFTGGNTFKPILNSLAYIQSGVMADGNWANNSLSALSSTHATGNGVNDYFAGALLGRFEQAGDESEELSRIIGYDPNTNTCTLEQGYAVLSHQEESYRIVYDFNPINATRPTLHIAGGSHIDNFYVGSIVEDITLTQAKGGTSSTISEAKIVSYNGLTRTATLDRAFDSAWKSTDNYIIRKVVPKFKGIVNKTANGTSGIVKYNNKTTSSSAVLKATIKNGGTGYSSSTNYTNSANTFKIKVDSVNSGAIASFTILNPGLGGTFSINDEITISGGGGNAVLTVQSTAFAISLGGAKDDATTSITFPGGNNNLVGDFIYVPSRYPTNDATFTVTNLNSYPGNYPNQYPSTTKIASASGIGTDATDYGPNWPNFCTTGVNTLANNSTCWKSELPLKINNESNCKQIIANYQDSASNANFILVKDAFTSSPSPLATYGAFLENTYFEILPFTKDGYSPMKYYGSRVSQQQEVCYDIELSELLLPNQNLKNATGGLLSCFSHIFVELSPQNGGNSRAFASNNPNARTALFKVPVLDISHQNNCKFIKLDGRGVTHTIKFRPNESFHFRVFLPDGTDLEYGIKEHGVPLFPNPDNQISSLFRYKRV